MAKKPSGGKASERPQLGFPVDAFFNEKQFKKFLKSPQSGPGDFTYYPYYYFYPALPGDGTDESTERSKDATGQHSRSVSRGVPTRVGAGNPRGGPMMMSADGKCMPGHIVPVNSGMTPGAYPQGTYMQGAYPRGAFPQASMYPTGAHVPRGTANRDRGGKSKKDKHGHGKSRKHHKNSASSSSDSSSSASSSSGSGSTSSTASSSAGGRRHKGAKGGKGAKGERKGGKQQKPVKGQLRGISNRSHRKPPAKGTCFLCNALFCGACDNPGGCISWINCGGCCDRSMIPPTGCCSRLRTFNSDDYRQALTHKKRACCCEVE